MRRYRNWVFVSWLLLATIQVSCAQSSPVALCESGERLSADGERCENIRCVGGEIVGNDCECPAGQVNDRGICRDPDDPCIDVLCNDANPCTEDVCANSACSFEPAANGAACNTAEIRGFCIAGVCEEDPCARIVCGDGNECTVDGVCNPATASCEGTQNATDGLTCSFGDSPGRCDAGVCEDAMLCAGRECDDTDPCTEDTCNPMTGECSNSPLAEFSSCDLGEGMPGECVEQMCVGLCDNEATRCDDDDLCTDDTCDAETGCQNTEKSCSDGNSCTSDGCNTANGNCINTDLDDGTSCRLSCPISQQICFSFGRCDGGVCKSFSVFEPPILP